MDHYALLGVARDAPTEAIRVAYIAQIKICHPDFAPAADTFDRFHALQRAYECLRSPEQRARYDLTIGIDVNQRWQRMNRAQRRLKKIGHNARPMVAVERAPHWRAAAIVAASGSLVLGACYILLR